MSRRVDLVVRGGLVVDGSGAEPYAGDVAVADGRILAVGDLAPDLDPAATIDATGRLVTPGFVDPHSHFDGQVTWDTELGPSSWHGVTTTVMGNCGVGFAPVRPEARDYLIMLMEGVEDIPGTALHDGIRWDWETFPEYLDAVSALARSIDVAAQLPHGALRVYVMGERAATQPVADAADVAAMAALARDALDAGAVAISSNRLALHTAKDGTPVPGTFADEAELTAFADALGGAGRGLLQVTGQMAMGQELDGAFAELDLYARLTRRSGRPVMFSLTEVNQDPDLWKRLLDHVDAANASGAQLIPQTHGRPNGLVVGWDTFNPFGGRPSYDALATLDPADRLTRLRDATVRAAILAETAPDGGRMRLIERLYEQVFPMVGGPVFEPTVEESVAGLALARGVDPTELLYDLMLDHWLLLALGGYRKHDLSSTHGLLTHPDSVLGLADGGAHCSIICDASVPSFLLQHWVRDRTRGPRLDLADAVRMLTSRPAEVYGFADRGRLRPGLRADINVVDLDGLTLHLPEVLHDLPTGAKRVVQRADGFDTTICAGEVTFQRGVATDARPGVLVR